MFKNARLPKSDAFVWRPRDKEQRIVYSNPNQIVDRQGETLPKPFRFPLEADVCTQLKPAWVVLASRLTEASSIGKVCVHTIQVGPIESIEEFNTELKVYFLGDPRVF